MSDKTAVAEPVEKNFSKAQTKHFNELQVEFRRAQAALQKFTDYLSEEHELDEVELPAGWGWQIGQKGFIAVRNQQDMSIEPPPLSEDEPAKGKSVRRKEQALPEPVAAGVNGAHIPSEEL
jgi:hypothetical protein